MRIQEYADTPLRLQCLREIGIEEEFLLIKAGTPRRLIKEKDYRTLLENGNCTNANALMKRLKNLFLPPMVRTNKNPQWVRYSKVVRKFTKQKIGESEKLISVETGRQWSTPGQFYYGRINTHIESHRLWANLILGRYGLGIRWAGEEWHDAIMLDLDHYFADGSKADFYSLPASRRRELMEPWLKAIQQLIKESGEPLEPFFMASGGKGFWLHIFLDGLAQKDEIFELQQRIIQLAEANGVRLGAPCNNINVNNKFIDSNGNNNISKIDDNNIDNSNIIKNNIDNNIDNNQNNIIKYDSNTLFINPESSLDTFVCRVPLSIHQTPEYNKRLALYLDPYTGDFSSDILLRLQRSGDTQKLLVALGIRKPDWEPGKPVSLQVSGEEACLSEKVSEEENCVPEKVSKEASIPEIIIASSPTPPSPTIPLFYRGDRIRQRKLPEMLLALERGESVGVFNSIETILPREIPRGETYQRLITEGRLAMALAWLHSQGTRDLETWIDTIEKSVQPILIGGDIQKRWEDIRDHIKCHHKNLLARTWEPYLPKSVTSDDVIMCENLAVDIINNRPGQGRKLDCEKIRDLLLTVIVKSKGAATLRITYDQWMEFMEWVEPGLLHGDRSMENARRKFTRYLRAIIDHGLLACTQTGSTNTPSTYTIHWAHWSVSDALEAAPEDE